MQKKKTVEEPAYDKPLPESIDTERLILGACIGRKENLDLAAEETQPEEFSISAHKLIFQRMLDLRSVSVSVDRVTLADCLLSRGELETVGGLSYLVDLDAGLPEFVNLKDYIEIVKEKARLRKVIVLANDAIQRALAQDASQEVVQQLEGSLYVSFAQRVRTGVTKMSDWIQEQIDSYGSENLLNPRNKQGYQLTTGIKPLDDLTDGFHESEVWTIGAGAGVGKSAIATQIMMHIVSDLKQPVLMFSLEMSKEAIFRRIICQLARVPVIRFKAGNVSSEERWRLAEATQLLDELPIYIDDTGSLTGSQLAIRTRRAKEKWGIVLTIVDYVQLVKSSDPRHRSYERMSEVSDTIRALAKETTPFLQLSQLNRDFRKDKREPGMHDLKESGSIENNSHVIVLPWREDMAPGASTERGNAKLILAKNRDASTAKIPMRYLGWRMLFVPEDQIDDQAEPEPEYAGSGRLYPD